LQQLLLLDRCRVLVVLTNCRCLSPVALDGLIGAGGIAVVHKPITEALSPEWRSAKLVCGGLVKVFGLGGLRDAISCPHAVKQEVAVGVDDRIADELGDLVGTTVDERPCPSFVNALQTGSFGSLGAFQESSSATAPTSY
jgi:hypothetical protein